MASSHDVSLCVLTILSLCSLSRAFTITTPLAASAGSPVPLLRGPPSVAPALRASAATLRMAARPRVATVLGMGAGDADLDQLEKEAEEAIDLAEKLWEEALDARTEADKLSGEAEVAASESQDKSQAAAQTVEEMTTFSLKSVVQGREAVNMSVEAVSALTRAQEALIKAEELENKAEEALARSEEILDQLAELEGEMEGKD